MNFPTGFHSLFTAICGSCCLFPGTGLAQSVSSISVEKTQNQATVVYQIEQQSILKSTNITTPVSGTTKQKQPTVSRSSQQFLQELALPVAKAQGQTATDPFAAVLNYGWQEYRLGNYRQAKEFFLQAVASDNVENHRNAEYGLLYSHLKLGDTRAALPLLQQFVARGEQLESTAPPLAAIFFEQGNFEALRALLPKLSPVQRKDMQEQIVVAQFQHDLLVLQESSRPEEVRNFLQRYNSFFEACRQPEQFFRMAKDLVERSTELAKKIFANLSRCLPDNQHWQERVLREQLHLLSNEELLAAASAPSDGKMSESNRNRLLQESLWLRLDKADQRSDEYESFVQLLYEQDPTNREVASMAAWSCYQREEYDCAIDIFSTLIQELPTDDALLGLVYALQKNGALLEALEQLEQHSNGKTAIFNQVRHDLHATLGGDLYRNKNYEKATLHLEQALTYQAKDVALTEMLLWSRYHLGESKPLVDFLWQQYQESGSADTAKSLSNLFGTLDDPVLTGKVMASFAESETAELQKIAGDYAFQQKHPVLADQIYQGQSPYAGSAVPAFDTTFHFRSKGGDNGTSSLNVGTLIIRQKVSSHSGKTWSLTLFPMSIYSKALPKNVPVGSMFRSPDQSQVQPELWQEHVFAWGWRGALQIEGNLDWDIRVGTTPLNGIVAPTPVGKIESSGSDWKLAMARDPVRDSILSWLGQTDPYSGREWGRVVQTSLAGAKTISFSDWWLAFEGKFGWYQGKNVEQNSSLTASISGGYTTDWKDFERSTGLFLFARGFKRNSNFYTFGHGGYYSPAQQIIGGPFFRLATSPTSRYWLEASCSAGLNYRKTDDAPRYTELGAVDIGAEDPGWHDLFGTYSGESETGLGLDARVRGIVPLSDGWFVGGEASINNVTDFTQWQLAVALRYRFGKGMGLGLPERDFSTLTSLVQ